MTDSRAQSPLDFAIAMGIFLVAVTFVFTFIPSLTAPFVEGNQDRSATADRVASHLAEGALGDPADPFVVNDSCATVFFNTSTDDSNIPSGCGYSGNDTDERVGVNGDRLRVNVTVEQVNVTADGDDRFRTVCHNSSVGVIHEENASFDCDTRYVAGDESGNRSSVVVAQRIVTIPGCDFDTGSTDVKSCDATLRVRVW
jgi:hypothetical protein